MGRFAALYRAACADLALADAYQLPPNTVQYLHRLVGKAHNQFYRARKFNFPAWKRILLEEVPRRIFHDRCVQLAFVLFWGLFILSLLLARYDRNFAYELIGEQQLTMYQDMHSNKVGSGSPIVSPTAASFYIQHNTSIGLECFCLGHLYSPRHCGDDLQRGGARRRFRLHDDRARSAGISSTSSPPTARSS